MSYFKLYQSGIHYSNIYFEEELVYHEKLDILNNTFDNKDVLTEEDNTEYIEGYKIDLLKLNRKLTSYNDTFKKDYSINEELTTDFDEKYSKLDEYTYVQRYKQFPLDIVVVNQEVVGFICVSRENCTVLIKKGYESYTPLKLWEDYIKDEKLYGVEITGTHMVKMRDNISLATDVYLPKSIDHKVPTILIRTPYGKEANSSSYLKYVQRGYALVIQDVRGRNYSEGEWDPCTYEQEDGDDTLNWIASNSWSDKSVGMIGGSYLGYVQWSAASSNNPYLKALVSIVTSGSPFVDIPRKGGSLVSGTLAWAFAVSQKKMNPSLMVRDDWDEILNIRPLKDIPKKALGYDIPFFNKWLEHRDCDDYWKKHSWHSKKDNINVPAMVVSGWYDDDQMGTNEALDIIKDYPVGNRKVILGPWMHSANTIRDINEKSFGNNSIRFDLDYYYLSWFDNKLKGIDNKIDKTYSVEYYSVNENKWKYANNWPIENIENKNMYLSSNVSAKTSSGDGALAWDISSTNSSDTYTYDPTDPALYVIDMSSNEMGVPTNYIDVEKREDVLCFTSDVFEKALTITGNVVVKFYASSSAKDTDWVVRLTEVDENNNSIKLVDGLLCAKYREGFNNPRLMEEGEVYEFTIKTNFISNTFMPESKLRLSITSSAKNLIFPHSNTENGYDSEECITANNTIYSGKNYPSHIVLPIERP